MDITIADLVSFIHSQPEDRPVDNTSWNTCIVGDFAREVLGVQIATRIMTNGYYDYRPVLADPVLQALWKSQGTTYCHFHAETMGLQYIEDCPTMMDLLNESMFLTYGAAQRHLMSRTD